MTKTDQITRTEFWENIREYEGELAYGSETILLGHVTRDCGGEHDDAPLNQDNAAWWLEAYRNYATAESAVQAIRESMEERGADQRDADGLITEYMDRVIDDGVLNGDETPSIMRDKEDLGELYDDYAPLPFSRDDFIFWASV